jgi:CHAD domain
MPIRPALQRMAPTLDARVQKAEPVAAPTAADSLGLRLKAFALAQLDQAERHLAREGEDRHAGIHQARKCLRRSRALLALATKSFAAESERLDAALGRLCRGLSSLRDAHAILEALRQVQTDAPTDTRAALAGVDAPARAHRDALLARALARDPEFAARRQRLRGMRERLARLDWSAVDANVLRDGLARSERRLAKARKRARKHPQDDELWHSYRRKLRRLRQQDSLLAEIGSPVRPDTEGLAERAHALGASQDDFLVLRYCAPASRLGGGRLPRAQRERLRALAQERLRRARSV